MEDLKNVWVIEGQLFGIYAFTGLFFDQGPLISRFERLVLCARAIATERRSSAIIRVSLTAAFRIRLIMEYMGHLSKRSALFVRGG